MSLGDIERRLRELEQQFQTLLEKATDDPAAYGGQFKEILDEQTFLKEKRSVILANTTNRQKPISASWMPHRHWKTHRPTLQSGTRAPFANWWRQ